MKKIICDSGDFYYTYKGYKVELLKKNIKFIREYIINLTKEDKDALLEKYSHTNISKIIYRYRPQNIYRCICHNLEQVKQDINFLIEYKNNLSCKNITLK